MNKLLIFIFIILRSHPFLGQSIYGAPPCTEINDNGIDYHSIDTILSSKKVILLGELDHGDGSSFMVKTELIKYLHENHNFNTLVFEASFINCHLLWSTISDSLQFREDIKNNIYPIWSEVKETRALFEYIEEQYYKGTPLRIIGIDPQFSGNNKANAFIGLLKQELPSTMTDSKQFADFVHELEIMSTWMVFPKEGEHLLSEECFAQYCDTILETIRQNHQSNLNLSIWEMYLNNVKTMGRIKRQRNNDSFEMRDEQMFKNVKYWLSEHKDDKYIIWAANAHIIRQDSSLEKRGRKYPLIGLKKLGDYMYDAYRDSMYSIAITAGRGSTLDFSNPKKKNSLRTPKSGSLEGLMKGKRTSFVDLKSFENEFDLTTYHAQLFYTNIICKARWSQHFDGFIYIPEMAPSTPLWQTINR